MKYSLVILAALALAGCSDMTDAQVREAKARCLDAGGNPVVMVHLWGAVEEVRCL